MRRQVRTAIGAVCEELLMNALYDAPVDEDGKPIFAEVDPHDRTETRSPRPVSIRYAATDELFAVAVRDRFGRLAKNTILAYIEKCIHSPNQIDRKTYGAGLGLYLVANAAATLRRQRRVRDRDRGRVHVRSRREDAAAAGRRVRPPGRRRDAEARADAGDGDRAVTRSERWLSASSARTGWSARSPSAAWPRSTSRRPRASPASRSTSRSR